MPNQEIHSFTELTTPADDDEYVVVDRDDTTDDTDGTTKRIQGQNIVTKKIKETAGPTVLSVGAVADGEFLKRSGSSIVSATAVSGVPDDSITNAKLANMAQATIKGRASGAGTGDPTDLTGTQATAILDTMVGDLGSGGTKGLVPAPGAGDAAAGKFLKADGTFAVPSGTGAETGANSDITSMDGLTGALKAPTQIQDANSNEVLKFGSTASAVNEVTVTNKATGNGPTVEATGGDTDIDLALVSKGTGIVKANGVNVLLESLEAFASDLSTALTTGTGKGVFFMPYAMTVTEVFAGLATPQTSGSIFTVDLNEAGSTILSTKITIDNTEDTSLSAATPPVISDASLAKGAKITIDIDQIGDGTAKGLVVVITGVRG
jgi:hypothetical protein